MKLKFFFLITLFFSLFTHAIAATTYLKAKAYLDVASGKLIQPANILIKDGTIEAINPTTTPADAVIIAKPNLILLPGLMDMHVHLPNDFLDKNFLTEIAKSDAAVYTTRGSKNARLLLMAGFTTVRNLGIAPVESFVDVALAKASDAGWIDAPHIIPCGHPLSITGGHMDVDMAGSFASQILPMNYRLGVADGVDEVTKSVRYQIKYGAKVIKVAGTAGVLSDEDSVGAQQYSDEELNAIVQEASRHNVPVAVHAHGTEGIKAAIKAGARSIEHGSLIDDEGIRLMKEHGTYLVSTTYIADDNDFTKLSPIPRKKAEYLIPLARQNITRAIQNKVTIVFGTDAPLVPHGQNAKEFSALVKRGMSPLDAIKTSTINAAEMMKLTNRGQIKPGFDADMIGVTEDPLKNIAILESVEFVMKDGRVMKG